MTARQRERARRRASGPRAAIRQGPTRDRRAAASEGADVGTTTIGRARSAGFVPAPQRRSVAFRRLRLFEMALHGRPRPRSASTQRGEELHPGDQTRRLERGEPARVASIQADGKIGLSLRGPVHEHMQHDGAVILAALARPNPPHLGDDASASASPPPRASKITNSRSDAPPCTVARAQASASSSFPASSMAKKSSPSRSSSRLGSTTSIWRIPGAHSRRPRSPRASMNASRATGTGSCAPPGSQAQVTSGSPRAFDTRKCARCGVPMSPSPASDQALASSRTEGTRCPGTAAWTVLARANIIAHT